MDGVQFHSVLCALAFLEADSAAMVEQRKWFLGKPEENVGLALASDTEAYTGHPDIPILKQAKTEYARLQ